MAQSQFKLPVMNPITPPQTTKAPTKKPVMDTLSPPGDGAFQFDPEDFRGIFESFGGALNTGLGSSVGSAINEQFDSLNLGGISGQLNAVNSRLSGLDDGIQDLRSTRNDLNSIGGGIENLSGQVNRMQNQMGDLDVNTSRDFSNLFDTLGSVNTNIQGVNQNFGNITNQVSQSGNDLSEQISRLDFRQDLSPLSRDIASVRGDLRGDINAVGADVRSGMGGIVNSVGGVANNIGDVRNQLGDVRSQIGSGFGGLASQIGGIPNVDYNAIKRFTDAGLARTADQLDGSIGSGLDAINRVVGDSTQAINSGLGDINSGLNSGLSGLRGDLLSSVGGLNSNIGDVRNQLGSGLDGIDRSLTSVGNDVLGGINNIDSAMTGGFGDIGRQFLGGLDNVQNQLGLNISSVGSDINSAISQTGVDINSGLGAINSGLNSGLSGINSGLGDITTSIDSVRNMMGQGFGGLRDEFGLGLNNAFGGIAGLERQLLEAPGAVRDAVMTALDSGGLGGTPPGVDPATGGATTDPTTDPIVYPNTPVEPQDPSGPDGTGDMPGKGDIIDETPAPATPDPASMFSSRLQDYLGGIYGDGGILYDAPTGTSRDAFDIIRSFDQRSADNPVDLEEIIQTRNRAEEALRGLDGFIRTSGQEFGADALTGSQAQVEQLRSALQDVLTQANSRVSDYNSANGALDDRASSSYDQALATLNALRGSTNIRNLYGENGAGTLQQKFNDILSGIENVSGPVAPGDRFASVLGLRDQFDSTYNDLISRRDASLGTTGNEIESILSAINTLPEHSQQGLDELQSRLAAAGADIQSFGTQGTGAYASMVDQAMGQLQSRRDGLFSRRQEMEAAAADLLNNGQRAFTTTDEAYAARDALNREIEQAQLYGASNAMDELATRQNLINQEIARLEADQAAVSAREDLGAQSRREELSRSANPFSSVALKNSQAFDVMSPEQYLAVLLGRNNARGTQFKDATQPTSAFSSALALLGG